MQMQRLKLWEHHTWKERQKPIQEVQHVLFLQSLFGCDCHHQQQHLTTERSYLRTPLSTAAMLESSSSVCVRACMRACMHACLCVRVTILFSGRWSIQKLLRRHSGLKHLISSKDKKVQQEWENPECRVSKLWDLTTISDQSLTICLEQRYCTFSLSLSFDTIKKLTGAFACVHLCSTCALFIEADYIRSPLYLYFLNETNTNFEAIAFVACLQPICGNLCRMSSYTRS